MPTVTTSMHFFFNFVLINSQIHQTYVFSIFIQRLNPRAKALGPNQNKNAQIQLVKFSKQKVFVKFKNLSDYFLHMFSNQLRDKY
jgi:hypothetical protein